MSIPANIRTKIRKGMVSTHTLMLRKIWGMQIGKGARISLKARIDRTHPKGVIIGEDTGIGAGAVVLTHDFINTRRATTSIGKNCHIGINSLVLPGITIGDHCIVAPASVVMKDVPSGSLVAGNPARIIETGLTLGPWGIRNWDGKR